MLTMSLLSTVALTLLFCILSHLSNVHCAKLFPFGNKSVRVPDEDIKKIRLSRPLNFFEKKYNELYVSDDGVIVFDLNTKANTNKPKRFPYEHSVIAPLWHDFDGVQQHYREIAASSGRTDVDELNRVSDLVQMTHPYLGGFEASWAMVFTWFNVTRYGDQSQKTHTFPAVLVSNDNATFAIFLYGDVQNGGSAQVGVNAGHCKIYNYLCISLTEKTNDMMHVRPCDGDYGVVGFR